VKLVAEAFPDVDPVEAILGGLVAVDGIVRTNPRSLVRQSASIRLATVERPLRGEAKLEAALAAFRVDVEGRSVLDVGAAAGGFTRVLLRHGARRVYAVDVGYGQLVGSLRRDRRVVVLERTNLADLDTTLVPESIELVTVDVSYVALADAIPQLGRSARFARESDLLALVKPQFELGLARPPRTTTEAVRRATAAIEASGWSVVAAVDSPVTGSRGRRRGASARD
jgi:23S rRNA (cytidine1920-2'-O)/16S rRNA (cytidine1409-2'-O)-methyltransferase